MGKVYLAEHPFMGRRAAIKILRAMYLDDKNMVARFVNEARAANAIHHPNIVEIIDVGYLPDGPPYLMMEFLEGETLGMRLTRLGRLSTAEAVHVLDQAASALEAAHAAGIVHRDLKPDNLFVVPDAANPGAERVKVVDFGIAKLEGPGMASSVLTTGIVLGTPNYMSPEQCRGASVDHRTDIYALGAIMYQSLCGKPPFVGEGQIDVMMMQMVKIPTAPRELFPEIPEYLEQIVMRALAKNPDDRFASMGELRAALAALPASMEASAGMAWPAGQAAALSAFTKARAAMNLHGRRRLLWVSLAVVLGIGVGWVGARRLRGTGAERTHAPAVNMSRATSEPPPVAPGATTPAAAVAPSQPPPTVRNMPAVNEPASRPPPVAGDAIKVPARGAVDDAREGGTPRVQPSRGPPGVRSQIARQGSAIGADDPLPPSIAGAVPSTPSSVLDAKKKGHGSKRWMDKW